MAIVKGLVWRKGDDVFHNWHWSTQIFGIRKSQVHLVSAIALQGNEIANVDCHRVDIIQLNRITKKLLLHV